MRGAYKTLSGVPAINTQTTTPTSTTGVDIIDPLPTTIDTLLVCAEPMTKKLKKTDITTSQLVNHISSGSIHATLDDSKTSTSSLWSGSKTQNYVDATTASLANHIADDTRHFRITANECVIGNTALQCLRNAGKSCNLGSVTRPWLNVFGYIPRDWDTIPGVLSASSFAPNSYDYYINEVVPWDMCVEKIRVRFTTTGSDGSRFARFRPLPVPCRPARPAPAASPARRNACPAWRWQ